MVEVTNTSHLKRGRPFISLATVQDMNGRIVQGFGVSYLTRNRATNKAIDAAKEIANNTQAGIRINKIDFRATKIDIHHNSSGGFEWNVNKTNETFHIPPIHVSVTAISNGQSMDGSKSGLFSLSRAFEGAVQSALNRLE